MKIKHLLTIVALFCLTATQAQSVDDIVNKYFENTGGRDKWNALQGMKISAKLNQGGMEIPLDIYQFKDGRAMQVISFQGKEIKQGVYDGTTLWSHNFMNMKAEKSDAEATANYKLEIGEFPDVFLHYKERGLTAELLGKETIDGTETFKIKLTKKPIMVDGKPADNVVFYFFDAENYVPLMMEAEVKSGPAKGMVSQIKWSDYQDVGGLMMPFSMAQGAKGQGSQPITITNIELNPKVDDAAFKYPEGN
jgi:outer membrane lipoprotein-sorting protein